MSKKKDDAGVLGSLPATRPTGLRADRSKPAARPKAASKPKAAAKRKPATPRPAAITTTEPAPATPAAPAREPATPRRPRPVRAGAPALAESTERARSDGPGPREPGAAPPSGTELVTTAIQAAGELAQIGLKLSGHALKRAVDRLPKP